MCLSGVKSKVKKYHQRRFYVSKDQEPAEIGADGCRQNSSQMEGKQSASSLHPVSAIASVIEPPRPETGGALFINLSLDNPNFLG